jgi:hypothetical protein
MKGKVNCTCGWSWNKSDSSSKDMYICHECGRDNSNNMKNGGWLDNYGTQANYNDSKATASPDMRGDGFSNVGRNYSPAWGGQFQEGGKLKFLQPTSDRLPEGYRIPYDTPSTERATSIGGVDGEPAYLVPEFKYGEPLYDPIEEFKRTGEHLGGPFKTWQEADEWENTVRHPAVENRETIMFPQEKFQAGGSLPGSVGFTYARTKGIPSNGPYAKKTLPSAQNGKDMYDNPIIARRVDNTKIDRSYYDPRLNTMNIGSDYTTWRDEETGELLTGDDLKYHQDKMLAHENYHAIQHSQGRDNYDIAHNTNNRQWAEMQKRPELMSTDSVWSNFYNRSDAENQQDYQEMISNFPESRILNQNLLFDKILDRQRYDNPANLEGEAKFYEETGASFQNGGEMKFYQNGLDFKPKSISRDGAWLDQYDVAQNGKKKFKLKDERLQATRPSESTFVKKPNFEAEQAKVQRTYVDQVGKQMAEDKRRKKLTKEQREREDYNARNEQTGSIQTPVEESTWDRTKAIASNPLTAFGYAARNESLPTRFQFGERNTLDNAIDWVNPLQGVAALSEIPGELGRGELLNAGLSALDAADLGVYFKGAKQLRNINPEGKVFNGLNNQLDDIAIKNTERYMAKRTPSNIPLSKEMNPQLLDNFDPGEYTPFQEDDYMKWFNEQKDKLNPRPVKQDPRSILRRKSIIDINDMKEGGVIKDDMGQWKYPGEITEIGSNQITMQGVPYDVLGISDTGDTKLMKPGKDYKFKGKKVTEFPMAKNGRRQEQKGLVNLDDLTNFTNYNKQQPAGWLSKYN